MYTVFFFQYTLETFGESRSTCWAYEPYTGKLVILIVGIYQFVMCLMYKYKTVFFLSKK